MVNAGADFLVTSQGDCNAGGGTLVRLPRPDAVEVCTGNDNLVFANSINSDGSPIACLPDGVNTINWTVYDETGNPGSDGVDVTVVAGALPFAVTAAADNLTPFVNTKTNNVQVTANTGGAPVAPVTWLVAPTQAPEAAPADGLSTVIEFSSEGNYCPLYVVATDNGGAGNSSAPSNDGAPVNEPPCFAIDNQDPTHVLTGFSANDSFNYGAQVLFDVQANDLVGEVRSGIGRIAASIDPVDVADPNTGTLVHDQSFACSPSASFGLPVCNASQVVNGCNQAVAACSGGKLQLGKLAPGAHALYVYVTDQAGNTASVAYPFAVSDLTVSFNAAIMAMDALLIDPGTPISALTPLSEARSFVNTADSLFADLPGLAFLQTRRALERLSSADAAGADVQSIMDQLAGAVTGEARRMLEETENQGFLNWNILERIPADNASYSGLYINRTFLMEVGGMLRDFTVGVNNATSVARSLANGADVSVQGGLNLEAVDAALAAHDALVMLFDDDTVATLAGRAVHEVEAGVSEKYFRGSPPSHFGDLTARTVADQLSRVAINPGLSVDQRNTLADVATLMDEFAAAVAPIKDGLPMDGSFTNKDLVENVYLKAQTALEALRTVQASSGIYSYYWQAALGLTVGYVINFSMYEGVTALTRGLNLGGADLFQVAGDQFYASDGSGAVGDVIAQVAECRYNRVMNDLSQSRINSAMQIFSNSKCLIIDLYNRYYSTRTDIFPCDTDTGIGDCPIDPTDYGCNTPLQQGDFDLAVECPCAAGGAAADDSTCDGIDDDCDGLVDEDYVTTSCSTNGSSNPACIGQSSCVNGVELPCVPPSASTSVDLSCNGIDDDCDAVDDDDFVVSTCGVGICGSTSSCVAGVETACTPDFSQATPEVCNSFDDDCDVLVDEGLDNDHDGYGCEPPTLNGVAWYNTAWSRRRKVTFDNTVSVSPWTRQIVLRFDNNGQAENLQNFPVLVKLNSSRIDYGRRRTMARISASLTQTIRHYLIKSSCGTKAVTLCLGEGAPNRR
ncbi:MAG: hypothetical protein R3C68_08050 [Myxococcota bacterium]